MKLETIAERRERTMANYMRRNWVKHRKEFWERKRRDRIEGNLQYE